MRSRLVPPRAALERYVEERQPCWWSWRGDSNPQPGDYKSPAQHPADLDIPGQKPIPGGTLRANRPIRPPASTAPTAVFDRNNAQTGPLVAPQQRISALARSGRHMPTGEKVGRAASTAGLLATIAIHTKRPRTHLPQWWRWPPVDAHGIP